MKKQNTILSVVTLCLVVLFVAVPLIVFAGLNYWPTWNTAIDVTFWVLFIACPVIYLAFQCFVCVRKTNEAGITYLQFGWVIALQFLPCITLLFSLIKESWAFIFPVVIAALAIIGFIITVVSSSFLANKMVETQKKVEAPKVEVVNADETFNNDDGTFKGSRVKVNKKK